MTTFWQLRQPYGVSDYKDSYVNGSLDHPYGLPGVECDICGAVYGGSRILTHECPPGLRQHKNLRDRWPISRADHARLQRQVMAALGIGGEPFVDLRPGDDFQPCFLDVPSRPRADFLWASLGSLVVTDRIKDLLLTVCPGEIAVCPVIPRKIGKLSAELPPPIPSTGEPEDIIHAVPLRQGAATAERYWEVLVLQESGFPPGGTPISVCSGCMRHEIGETREVRMTPQMWQGHGIFFLATTLYIVVTAHVRKAIERLRPTNVVFKPI